MATKRLLVITLMSLFLGADTLKAQGCSFEQFVAVFFGYGCGAAKGELGYRYYEEGGINKTERVDYSLGRGVDFGLEYSAVHTTQPWGFNVGVSYHKGLPNVLESDNSLYFAGQNRYETFGSWLAIDPRISMTYELGGPESRFSAVLAAGPSFSLMNRRTQTTSYTNSYGYFGYSQDFMQTSVAKAPVSIGGSAGLTVFYALNEKVDVGLGVQGRMQSGTWKREMLTEYSLVDRDILGNIVNETTLDDLSTNQIETEFHNPYCPPTVFDPTLPTLALSNRDPMSAVNTRFNVRLRF